MSPDENEAEVIENDGTLSVAEAATRIGITQVAVRKALREGRLRRCNPHGSPRFKAEEVDRFIHDRQAIIPSHDDDDADDMSPRDRAMLAKADTFTSLLSQAEGHSEETFKFALETMKESRYAMKQIIEAQGGQIKFLQARITQLEERETEVLEALDTLRKEKNDQTVAVAEAEATKAKAQAAIKLGNMLVPAVLARIVGGESLNAGAFKGFVNTLTDDQKAALMQSMGNILTSDQMGVLITLFSQWGAQDEAKKKAAPSEESAAFSA